MWQDQNDQMAETRAPATGRTLQCDVEGFAEKGAS